jgi:hypothetical protein
MAPIRNKTQKPKTAQGSPRLSVPKGRQVQRADTRFGPISAISTAPIAIGNSVQGASARIRQTPTGVRVVGRDFALTGKGTGNVVTWTPMCGMPITPAAMPSTVLKQYNNMYGYYKVHSLVAHYITSSPTSSNGDVALFYQNNHASPMLNFTSTSFLPYIISNDCTVLGPQWLNHSARLKPNDQWFTTDYLQNDDLTDQCAGELFLFSKTSTTDSPGYVLLDYDIEFKLLQLNVKNSIYPIPRAAYHQTSFGATIATTANVTPLNVGVYSTDIAGTTAVLPTGFAIGDIYKVFVDISNSLYTNATTSNIMSFVDPAGNITPITLTDGYTLFAVASSATKVDFYPTFDAAKLRANPAFYGATITYVLKLQVWMSLVGSVNTVLAQSNI